MVHELAKHYSVATHAYGTEPRRHIDFFRLPQSAMPLVRLSQAAKMAGEKIDSALNQQTQHMQVWTHIYMRVSHSYIYTYTHVTHSYTLLLLYSHSYIYVLLLYTSGVLSASLPLVAQEDP